ncbi:MAG: FKBP-type peptidyl-prolyl cis-trans isomerase [Verrucomicrobiota bacterium]
MKKIILSILCLGIALPLLAADASALTGEKSRASYAIGLNIGHSLKQQGLDLDPNLVGMAIKDVLGGGRELMTEAEVKETFQGLRAQQQARLAEQAVSNRAQGASFLAANKSNPGVQTLPDGLQYLVLTNGAGAKPGPADVVTVHYRGQLLDGTEFDSSYKRGEPASFPVNGVIPGWTEALQKMSVGSKWKLFIPSELAYGEKGRPGIPPNSVLNFEVELLAIKAATPPPPAQPLTSDIIKVPSAEEMKKGAKIEVIKPEDAARIQSGAK